MWIRVLSASTILDANGDNLAADVAGANAAGLTSVWLNRYGAVRDKGDPEPAVEISSLSELTLHLLR